MIPMTHEEFLTKSKSNGREDLSEQELVELGKHMVKCPICRTLSKADLCINREKYAEGFRDLMRRFKDEGLL